MKHQLLAIVLAAFALETAHAAPVSYKLPDETAAFKPGANLETMQNNCAACHSADYIKTQPRGEKFKKDFWAAEVTKMIKVYGAPIEDAESERSWIISPRIIENRFPARRAHTPAQGRPGRIPPTGKPELAAVSPRQKRAKPAKRQKCGAIWRIFAESAIPFALPSPPQPAYPDGSGMPVCAGTGGSFSFFDSAETT